MNLGKYIEKLLHVMSKIIQNAFLMSVAVRIAIRRDTPAQFSLCLVEIVPLSHLDHMRSVSIRKINGDKKWLPWKKQLRTVVTKTRNNLLQVLQYEG